MSFTNFLTSQKLLKTKMNDGNYDHDEEAVVVYDKDEANSISSETLWGTHKILLDLDVAHEYNASSTPGHGHLYIDAELSKDDYEMLMFLLMKAGAIQEGYFNQIIKTGHNTLRLPWVKKGGKS